MRRRGREGLCRGCDSSVWQDSRHSPALSGEWSSHRCAFDAVSSIGTSTPWYTGAFASVSFPASSQHDQIRVHVVVRTTRARLEAVGCLIKSDGSLAFASIRTASTGPIEALTIFGCVTATLAFEGRTCIRWEREEFQCGRKRWGFHGASKLGERRRPTIGSFYIHSVRLHLRIREVGLWWRQTESFGRRSLESRFTPLYISPPQVPLGLEIKHAASALHDLRSLRVWPASCLSLSLSLSSRSSSRAH